MIEIIILALSLLAVVYLKTMQAFYLRLGQDVKSVGETTHEKDRSLKYLSVHLEFLSHLINIVCLALLAVATWMMFELLGLAAIILTFVVFYLSLEILPVARHGRFVKSLAFKSAPVARKIMLQLSPLEKRLKAFREKSASKEIDTGIYSEADLIELLSKQKESRGNNIAPATLAALTKRLKFPHRKIQEIMRIKEDLKIVGASEAVGPILIDELHKTGERYFLVEEEFNNEIIGTLDLTLLTTLRKSGAAKDVMEPRIYHLNEASSLVAALDAFAKTGSPVFATVNELAEITGLVTVEQIIRNLYGEKFATEFTDYESRSSVSAHE